MGVPGRKVELATPGFEELLPPIGDMGRELGGVEVLEVEAKREETEGDDRL